MERFICKDIFNIEKSKQDLLDEINRPLTESEQLFLDLMIEFLQEAENEQQNKD